MEIYLWKIALVDCKWSSLNAPGSYTLHCYCFWAWLWILWIPSATSHTSNKRESRCWEWDDGSPMSQWLSTEDSQESVKTLCCAVCIVALLRSSLLIHRCIHPTMRRSLFSLMPHNFLTKGDHGRRGAQAQSSSHSDYAMGSKTPNWGSFFQHFLAHRVRCHFLSVNWKPRKAHVSHSQTHRMALRTPSTLRVRRTILVSLIKGEGQKKCRPPPPLCEKCDIPLTSLPNSGPT